MTELLEILKKSEDDAKSNRVALITDTFLDLRSILSNDKCEKIR